MIRFHCPTCNKRLKAPIDGAGKKIVCPKCGQRIEVPAPPVPRPVNQTVLGRLEPAGAPAGSVSLSCDTCAEPFLVPPDRIGTGNPIRCPSCDGEVKGFASGPPPVRRPAQLDLEHVELDESDDSVEDDEPVPDAALSRRKMFPRFLIVSIPLIGILAIGVLSVTASRVWREGEAPTCKALVERLEAKGAELRWETCPNKYPAIYVAPNSYHPSLPLSHLVRLYPRDNKVLVVIQYPTPVEAREAAGTKPGAISIGRFLLSGNTDLAKAIQDVTS